MNRSEIIDKILPAMVQAPSAHNTQPWQITVTDDQAALYINWDRHLTISDPTQRELYISLGCTLANIRIAAAHGGYETNIAYLPHGMPEPKSSMPVATIIFTPASDSNTELTTLYKWIEKRRTNRDLYDGRPLTQEERTLLRSDVSSNVLLIDDKAALEKIAHATEEGTVATLSRKDFKQELSHWVRNSWTRQSDGMPGYAMGMPAPVSLLGSIIVRLAPIHKQEGPKSRQQILSASAVAVIVTESDTPSDWLKAGEAMELLWLAASKAGLAVAPLASAIEASNTTRRVIQTAVGVNQYPQVILRLGHSHRKNLRATPRRTVTDCLSE